MRYYTKQYHYMLKKIIKNPWIKWPLLLILAGIIFVLGLFGSVYFGLWGKVPTNADLANLSQMQASQVYGEEELLIGKYYITDRESINYDDLPKSLIHALIATEDARFYEHNGIDKRSLFRVFFKTILLGDDSSGGGSTITMQLAKNLYGRKDYGFFLSIVINKFREMIVARRLEEIYSKNDILTLYFNTVPFSGNTYGIESAAMKFFGVHTRALNLSQAATLVGCLKANHSYNPRLFPERSQLRRDVVLNQMVKYGYISAQKAEQVMQQKIKVDFHTYGTSSAMAAYFRQQVKEKVEQVLAQKEYRKPDGTPYNLLTDGLKIYTTLNKRLQQYAEEAMQAHMKKLQTQFEKAYGNNPPWRKKSAIVQEALTQLPAYKRLKEKGLSKSAIIDSLSIPHKMEVYSWDGDQIKTLSTIDSLRYYLQFLNTGIVSLDPHTGAIRAYVGGIDYRYFQYDHVVQSKRAVGSTFKPIVYAAALEKGLQPCNYFPAQVVTYTDVKDWTPRNAEKIDPDIEYSLTAALAHSLNTIAVKVLRVTGIQPTITMAHKMGIEEDLPAVPSIALGTPALRVIDMARAYSCFLNEGRPITPFFIKRIEDKNGKVIVSFPHKEKEAPRAFSEQTRQEMLAMLQRVVDRGTGRRLRTVYHFRNDLAGKTGTTQNNTDGWFVGLLPDLVTVTWVGNDNHSIKFRRTAIGQGANSALPIFAGMLQRMNNNPQFDKITRAHFKRPSNAVIASMQCPPTRKEGFFKRLFSKDKVSKKFYTRDDNDNLFEQQRKEKSIKKHKKKKKKKKRGFFQRLFGRK